MFRVDAWGGRSLMYGMLSADCTDSQTVLRTPSLLTSLCRARRCGVAGSPDDWASRLLKALHTHKAHQCLWTCSRAAPDSSLLAKLHEPQDQPHA